MLEHFLISQIFAFFMIFCRIGSGVMLLPGFGESYVPKRIRLSIAIIISLLLTPLLEKVMPTFPNSAITLTLMIISEILLGLLIGSICKVIINATHVAGEIFSLQAGISSAVIYDVTQQTQGSLIGNFIGLTSLVVLFSTNLHHVMLRGITDSYQVFLPGKFPTIHDFIESYAHLVSETFIIAVQISAPMIIIGTLLFLGAGIISRLMPNLQIFFIITAPQLMIGFFILITAFSSVILFYMNFYQDNLTSFISYLINK